MKYRGVILIAYLVLLISCKGNIEGQSSIDKPLEGGAFEKTTVQSKSSKPQYNFKIKVKDGETIHYLISSDTKTETEVNENKIVSQNNTEILLKYQFSPSDSKETKQLKITYEKLSIGITMNDEQQKYSSENPTTSFISLDNILAAIKGQQLTLKLTEQGKLVSLSGTDSIRMKLIKLLQELPPPQRAKAEEFVSMFAGDAFVNNNLMPLFKIFPEDNIEEGYTWKQKNTMANVLSTSIENTFKLVSLTSKSAVIKSEGELRSNPDEKIDVLGNLVNATLNGSQSGEIKLNSRTGLVSSSVSTTKIKGGIIFRGQDVPLTIKVKKTIEQVN